MATHRKSTKTDAVLLGLSLTSLFALGGFIGSYLMISAIDTLGI